MTRLLLVPAVCFLSPWVWASVAIAHPGHGNDAIAAGSAMHQLTQPVHALPLVAVVVLVVVAGIAIGKRMFGLGRQSD